MFDFLWERYGLAAVPRSCAALRVSFLKSAAGVVAASIREITRPSGNKGTGCRRPMRCDAIVWALRVFLARFSWRKRVISRILWAVDPRATRLSLQLTAKKPATGTLRASFNYIVDTGVPPVRYIDWPEMEHRAVPPQYRQYEMAVRDGRPLRETFRLDIHGFAFAEHPTTVKDFTDDAECARVYDPEVQALIRKHSGASGVVVFDHTIRASDEALVFKVFDSDAGKPSRFTAHSAFDDPGTPAGAPPRESIETRTFAFFD
jgi:hypothetical protein